jgi:hypothetical protein
MVILTIFEAQIITDSNCRISKTPSADTEQAKRGRDKQPLFSGKAV